MSASEFITTKAKQKWSRGHEVDLDTRFEGESQNFSLDTIVASASAVCADVRLDAANKALLIHEEDCD